MLTLLELVMVLAVLPVAFCSKRPVGRLPRAVSRSFTWLAQRQGLAVLTVGVLGTGSSAALGWLRGLPEPQVHDEFSYLLAADTFARGRLTNPTHPLWVHFESFHVLWQPTYASKYPPGQGLFLALGQLLFGHPIAGVWLSVGLACAALCWMLQAWLPPRWALLAALLALLRLVFCGSPHFAAAGGYWSQSYWGGAVAALGGALVFGALRRLLRRPAAGDALLLGMGLAVLANSRPFEGLVVSLPAAAALLVWMTGKRRPPASVALGRVVLPVLGVLVPAAGLMALYNYRVTGDPFRMPYLVHEDTYHVAPSFLWRRANPEPVYRHKLLREFYTGIAVEAYREQHTVSGLVEMIVVKLIKMWSFYLGFLFLVPLVALPWVLKDRWMRFALLTCGVLLGALLLETWGWAHYAAPMTGLVFVLVVQGIRHLRLWRWRNRPVGERLLSAVLLMCVTAAVLSALLRPPGIANAWYLQRARILEGLRQDGGSHLVIVRYRAEHNTNDEWVYNEADIDGSAVVWAREMGPQEDRKLLDYFKGRRVWLLDADAEPPVLQPYVEAPRGRQGPAEGAPQAKRGRDKAP
jgi:hypothetical protein